MLIVQKFGGSSVANAAKLNRAAALAAEAYRAGNQVVTVVSAQGDTTDTLLRKAAELSPQPNDRELDALLATGEQASAALLAIALNARGLPAVSLNGPQLGIHTDAAHGNAVIRTVDAARIRRELDAGRLVVAAGFQGVDPSGDLTTLGRGGSDTTAVALAAALYADRCLIYTDVDGVYTADPRKAPEARRLDAIAWAEMLTLSSLGSQVLHDRCVALAMERGIELEVRAAAGGRPGTRVGDVPPRDYTGVTVAGDRVSLVGSALPGDGEAARRLREALRRRDIPLRAIIPSERALTAVVPAETAAEAVRAVHGAFF